MGNFLAPFKGYLYLAIVLGALAAAGAIYAKGRLDASHKAEVSNLRISLEAERQARAREAETRRKDALQAAEDAKAADLLETKVTELTHDLQDATRECLSVPDTDRLRGLWPQGAD